MKRVLLVILALVSVLRAVSAQDFSRRAMLENITNNIILPSNDALLESIAILQTAVVAFQADPSEDALVTMQDAWKASLLAWQPASLVGLRDVMSIHYRIFKWPTKEEFIEKFIAGEDILDARFAVGQGSNSVGLPAMEYLIFHPDGNEAVLDTFVESPRRADYLMALADDLVSNATQLQQYWQVQAPYFAALDGDGSSLSSGVSVVTNELLANLEGQAKVRIGVPLGIDDGDPRPMESVSRRSEMSIPQIRANIVASQRLFNGGDGLGLDDYLASIGQDDLIVTINSIFDDMIANLDLVTLPLEQAVVDEHEQVLAVYDCYKDVVRYMKADMTQQLGISVAFNESDGD